MTAHRERDAERAIERDLQAYRSVTDRDLPSVHDTARLRDHSTRTFHRDTSREGFWMKSFLSMQARPWLTTGIAVAIVAAILGIVPISYTRTIGHEVTLQFAAPAPQDESLRKIAGELRTALHADEVRVALASIGGAAAPAAELVATVPSRNHTEVQRTAAAFASALVQRGIRTDARVRPRTERISSNVYAVAMDRAVELRIERAGKTPAEIEADIRAQLEAAGIQNPQVQVTQEGDQTKVKIEAQSAAGDEEKKFDIQLQGGGDQPMNAQMHQFRVERKPGMTDAEVKADIERQMREAGVTGEVIVENGKIDVRVHKQE
jgi:hypothetical protein